MLKLAIELKGQKRCFEVGYGLTFLVLAVNAAVDMGIGALLYKLLS
jgi:hypothetical protein